MEERGEGGVKAGKRSPGSYQQDNSLWDYSKINHQLAPSSAFPTCQPNPQMLTFSRGCWPQFLLTFKIFLSNVIHSLTSLTIHSLIIACLFLA